MGFHRFLPGTGHCDLAAFASAVIVAFLSGDHHQIFARPTTQPDLPFLVEPFAFSPLWHSFSGSFVGGLVDGQGNGIANGTAVMQLVNAGDLVANSTNFALYLVGGLSDAADLAAALSGVGHVTIQGGTNIFAGNHMLFAYDVGNDIHIADVDFVNGLTGSGNTQGRTIVASDIADIVGGNNGSTTSLAILGINAHDVQFQHSA